MNGKRRIKLLTFLSFMLDKRYLHQNGVKFIFKFQLSVYALISPDEVFIICLSTYLPIEKFLKVFYFKTSQTEQLLMNIGFESNYNKVGFQIWFKGGRGELSHPTSIIQTAV